MVGRRKGALSTPKVLFLTDAVAGVGSVGKSPLNCTHMPYAIFIPVIFLYIYFFK